MSVERWVPDEFLRRVRQGHAAGQAEIARQGVDPTVIEPVEVAEMVEAHRWAWRPEKPRLVLVAESHVFTTLAELATTYVPVRGAEHAPRNYVRLVYCLGYGESVLCPGLRGGTPQYWKLFGDLVGTRPFNAVGAASNARLHEKVETLRRLRDRGVWLLDASLHGIYVPQGARIDAASSGRLTAQLQRLWWREYGQALLEDCQPERVVAIGKGLWTNMGYAIPFNGWVYQPQGARLTAQRRHNADALRDLAAWVSSSIEGGFEEVGR